MICHVFKTELAALFIKVICLADFDINLQYNPTEFLPSLEIK